MRISDGSNLSRGISRIAVVIAVFLLVDLAVIGIYLLKPQSSPQSVQEQNVPTLHADTLAVLENLPSRVELRFYSLLDPQSTDNGLRAFSDRVDQLLVEYEIAARGKIQVVRHKTLTDAEAVRLAEQDGITPFNMNIGDACFLGIAVVQQDRRETLPRLSPQWESAIEPDLSRAITRVIQSSSSTQTVASASAVDRTARAAAVEKVRQIIPNPQDTPEEDGTRMIRQIALEEFRAISEETKRLTQSAQSQLAAAQQSGSESNQKAAMQELQRIQQAQAQKLKEISARAEAQVEAWQELKRRQTD